MSITVSKSILWWKPKNVGSWNNSALLIKSSQNYKNKQITMLLQIDPRPINSKTLLLAAARVQYLLQKMCCMYPQWVVCYIIITQKVAFNVRPKLLQFTRCFQICNTLFLLDLLHFSVCHTVMEYFIIKKICKKIVATWFLKKYINYVLSWKIAYGHVSVITHTDSISRHL